MIFVNMNKCCGVRKVMLQTGTPTMSVHVDRGKSDWPPLNIQIIMGDRQKNLYHPI